MIGRGDIKREAAREGTESSLVERDYVEGWLLHAIADSSIAPRIAFKGGTALSRVYYWRRWRHSEDLDFAVVAGDMEWDCAAKAMRDEVPHFLMERAQIWADVHRRIHTNPMYMQLRMKYAGPIGRSTIKVEMTRSTAAAGATAAARAPVVDVLVPAYFDCPEFTTRAYSLEAIMAEKIRALVERGYARDYYDVWRLLGEGDYDAATVRRLFAAMCRERGTAYGIGDVGAEGTAERLGPHLRIGLTRLLREEIPPIADLAAETRRRLGALLGAEPPA